MARTGQPTPNKSLFQLKKEQADEAAESRALREAKKQSRTAHQSAGTSTLAAVARNKRRQQHTSRNTTPPPLEPVPTTVSNPKKKKHVDFRTTSNGAVTVEEIVDEGDPPYGSSESDAEPDCVIMVSSGSSDDEPRPIKRRKVYELDFETGELSGGKSDDDDSEDGEDGAQEYVGDEEEEEDTDDDAGEEEEQVARPRVKVVKSKLLETARAKAVAEKSMKQRKAVPLKLNRSTAKASKKTTKALTEKERKLAKERKRALKRAEKEKSEAGVSAWERAEKALGECAASNQYDLNTILTLGDREISANLASLRLL